MSRKGTHRVTKKELEEELRFELLYDGQNGINKIDDGANQWDSESWNELEHHARGLVLRLCPEFQGASETKDIM